MGDDTVALSYTLSAPSTGQTFVIYTRQIEVNVPMADAIFKMPP